MLFKYVPYDGQWLPIIPISLRCGRNELPPIDALVDTGATISIAPMEIAAELGIRLEQKDGLTAYVAGGGTSAIYPSPLLIECSMRDSLQGDVCRWQTQFFFAEGQRVVLLGHHRCLEKFDIVFRGPEKELEMTARFRSPPARMKGKL